MKVMPARSANPNLQRSAIRHLAEHPEDRQLLPPFQTETAQELIKENQRIVRENYGVEAYGQRLLSMYETLANMPPGKVSSASATSLLDTFLQPGRFNLLRT